MSDVDQVSAGKTRLGRTLAWSRTPIWPTVAVVVVLAFIPLVWRNDYYISLFVLILLFGQTRIFFVMSRDGLLPEALSRVHPKWKTPYIVTAITGVVVSPRARKVTVTLRNSTNGNRPIA